MKTENLFCKAAEELLLQGELSNKFCETVLSDVESHFNDFTSELHLDLALRFPERFNDSGQRIVTGLSIASYEYKIEESNKASSFDLYLKLTSSDWVGLYQLSPINPFLEISIKRLLMQAFKLFESEKLDSLNARFQNEIEEWNSNVFVVQERTFKHSRQLMNHLENGLGYSEELIITILNDYHERMNKRKLINLKRFERKMLEIMPRLEKENSPWKNYLSFLFDEIGTGGSNIKSTDDIYKNFMLLETSKEN